MFTFHHKSTILDITKYDCLAFVNPEYNDSDVFIEKIYADTTYPVNVSLLAVPADFDGYRENDISEDIKSNVIGKKVFSSVKIYGHPQANVKADIDMVKEVLVDEPKNIVTEEDYYTLKPGHALIFRAKAKAPNTEVHFSISFLEE